MTQSEKGSVGEGDPQYPRSGDRRHHAAATEGIASRSGDRRHPYIKKTSLEPPELLPVPRRPPAPKRRQQPPPGAAVDDDDIRAGDGLRGVLRTLCTTWRHSTFLPEDPPGVAPAALPERPEQLPARVGERAQLAWLLHAQVHMPAAEVAPPAGGERLDGERFSTRAAEAAVAEVGDGG